MKTNLNPTLKDKVLSLITALVPCLPLCGLILCNLTYANAKSGIDSAQPELTTDKVEYFNARIAGDIIQSVGPIDKQALLGNWRLVMVGPYEDKLGQYSSNGIQIGPNRATPQLSISATDLSWLANGANTQLNLQFTNSPFVTVNIEGQSISTSITSELRSPSNVQLEGNFAKFSISFHGEAPISFSCMDRGYFFDSNSSCSGNLYSYAKMDYSCGVQDGHPERLLCKQTYRDYRFAASDSRGNTRAYFSNQLPNLVQQFFFSNVIGFERVSLNQANTK